MLMKNVINALGRKNLIILALLLALTLGAMGCFVGIHALSRMLPSQLAAERWQGESEIDYAQISCFIPVDETVTLNEIAAFREAAMTRLHEAALDIDTGEQVLMADAWSCTEKVSVSSALGKGEVYATAVGGEYFAFHPIRLISGSYISASDLMQDRALLDEDTAWLLFGSTNIQGMSFKINGVPFLVAGVIEREDDFASKKAYTAGMGIFISYDAYSTLLSAESAAAPASSDTANATAAATSAPGIQCYELILPNPVKNFALNLVKEKFPIGRGEIVNNTERFTLSNLRSLLKSFDTRSMQTSGVIYPYWENASRGAEDRAVLLLLLGCVLLAPPVIAALILAVRYAVRGKRALEDDLMPRLKENAEEAIRVRARRRWEKQHGYIDDDE